jgi:hypothetical protein
MCCHEAFIEEFEDSAESLRAESTNEKIARYKSQYNELKVRRVKPRIRSWIEEIKQIIEIGCNCNKQSMMGMIAIREEKEK